MANNIPYTFLKLDILFLKWEKAMDRAKCWAILLKEFPEDDETAMIFAKWDTRAKLLYLEIERRADQLPENILEPIGIKLETNYR
jgi:hypothetical protein